MEGLLVIFRFSCIKNWEKRMGSLDQWCERRFEIIGDIVIFNFYIYKLWFSRQDYFQKKKKDKLIDQCKIRIFIIYFNKEF